MTVGAPDDLFGLCTSLVAIPSVSHQEGRLADLVQSTLDRFAWLTVERVGNNVIARTDLDRPTRVMLAGHLDTVPPVGGNHQPRVVDDVLYGVGAADMKGGLAVFLHLAGSLAEPAVDVTWCFYVCEEVEQRFNGLCQLWEQRPDLLRADVAILGEPTGGVVEAGCQGMLRVSIELEGRRAHTARPSSGRNAIHRLAPVLAEVAGYESRHVVLDSCEYVEQLQVVEVTGGVAANVVPDSATVLVNHRFAPDRTVVEAEASIRELLGPHLEATDRWEVVESASAAPPSLGHPVLATLVDATGAPPRGKQGWTDVASFWAHGIPAANFGPGDPLVAHTPGEHVRAGQVGQVAGVLDTLLGDGSFGVATCGK